MQDTNALGGTMISTYVNGTYVNGTVVTTDEGTFVLTGVQVRYHSSHDGQNMEVRLVVEGGQYTLGYMEICGYPHRNHHYTPEVDTIIYKVFWAMEKVFRPAPSIVEIPGPRGSESEATWMRHPMELAIIEDILNNA